MRLRIPYYCRCSRKQHAKLVRRVWSSMLLLTCVALAYIHFRLDWKLPSRIRGMRSVIRHDPSSILLNYANAGVDLESALEPALQYGRQEVKVAANRIVDDKKSSVYNGTFSMDKALEKFGINMNQQQQQQQQQPLQPEGQAADALPIADDAQHDGAREEYEGNNEDYENKKYDDVMREMNKALDDVGRKEEFEQNVADSGYDNNADDEYMTQSTTTTSYDELYELYGEDYVESQTGIKDSEGTGSDVHVDKSSENTKKLVKNVVPKTSTTTKKRPTTTTTSTTTTTTTTTTVAPSIVARPKSPDLQRCDAECQLFRSRLVTWPHDKPKAVIYYLIHRSALKNLYRSIESVDKHFNRRYRYPIVVFVEPDMDNEADRELIRSSVAKVAPTSARLLYIQIVHFQLPEYVDKEKVPKLAGFGRRKRTIGYRHMCRFHAGGVYDQPIIKSDGLEFGWRLDDDSLLTAAIKYDIFHFMHDRDIQYGYRKINRGWSPVDFALWDAVDKYINNTGLQPTHYHQWPKNSARFFNNFEISALKVWRSAAYQNYFSYVDRLGGIYYYKWGDAAIKTIAVTLFIPRDKTHLFKDVKYSHKTPIKR